MEISLIAAKVLGIYLVISGLFLIFRGKTVPYLIKDLFDHPAVLYITGAMLIFLSSIFLIQNNTWDGTWRTIITIFVWATLLKGIAYIFAPEALHRMIGKKLFESLNLYGFVALIIGVYLFSLGA